MVNKDSAEPRLKDVDETLAQAILADGLGIPVRRLDLPGAPPGTCDLGFKSPAGGQAVAEVVSTRDYATEQMAAATLKGHVPVPELQWAWGVSVADGTVVNKLRPELPAFLGDLEKEGIHEASDRRPGPIADRMKQLGITLCVAGPPNHAVPPGYHLNPQSTWTFTQDIAHAARRSVEFLLAPPQADVLAKLRNANADERHAVIVVTHQWLDVLHEIRDGTTLPTTPPTLPTELDGMWIVALRAGPTRGISWTRSSGWASVTLAEWRPPAWRGE
jgi:hypothetical protein